MRDQTLQHRFEELDAARALGNLSPDEHEELAGLVDGEGFKLDSDFDWIVAALEADQADASEPLDPSLKDKLIADAQDFGDAARPSKIIQIFKHPAMGWAAAACVALTLTLLSNPEEPPVKGVPPTLAESRAALIKGASPLQLPFAGTPGFPKLSGDVVWEDGRQEGYMSLAGLPANDPTVSQYQLWIVDPERAAEPVDGGVFDIPVAGGTTIVPINAALAVAYPAAFVITVEKPGGVVVSKQEVVAAIAKRAS